MRAPTLLLLLLLASPAAAEEAPSYTPEDASLMTACIERLSDGDSGDTRPQTECIGAASNACMENEEGGFTTVGMAACTARETAWWDSQLNAHYTSLEATLDADLFSALRDAQRAWIAYRDASCGFEYDLWSDGTIRSIVFAGCMLDLTARRAQTLARYATGMP